MKGLYKRGKMFWIAYRANGKLYRESTGETSQEEAEYFLTCRRKQIRDGKIAEERRRKNKKFTDLAQDYLKWAERQRSFKNKKLFVKQLVEKFGHLRIKDLNTKIIEQWQTERLMINKPATVNRLLATLKHMFTKAMEWDMLSEDILQKVRRVKLLREDNKRLRFLTVEDCQTLIDCCAGHLKPIVTVGLHSGMRLSEILGLRWEQIDLVHGFILLDTTKNGERREIPIDNTLRKMLNCTPHSIESNFVFTDRNGNPYKSVKKSFSTALRKAGIHDFRFHDLRHTFASHLVMNGVDLTTVKELLGHKSLTMTMRYSHLSPSHKKKAVNTLDSVLKNTRKETQVHSFSSQFESDIHNSLCALSSARQSN